MSLADDGSKRVFISGAFDLLHPGHVAMFRFGASFGNLYVAVGSDEAVREYKRRPIVPELERLEMVRAVRYVHRAELSHLPGRTAGFDLFEKWQPDIWIVDPGDPILHQKMELMAARGCMPVYNTPRMGISTTRLLLRAQTPAVVPMRVDFAGGWLDVPALAREDGYVVNCAVTPGLGERDWHHGGGLGGSAASAISRGEHALLAELKHVGWQDPAVITETGCCVWHSGAMPVLAYKTPGRWLQGCMAVEWTGSGHDTSAIRTRPRPYDMIEKAGASAAHAVRAQDLCALRLAVNLSYQAQLSEGMAPLVPIGEAAMKYLGAGWGGYALRVYPSPADRDMDIRTRGDVVIPIEPYCVDRALAV